MRITTGARRRVWRPTPRPWMTRTAPSTSTTCSGRCWAACRAPTPAGTSSSPDTCPRTRARRSPRSSPSPTRGSPPRRARPSSSKEAISSPKLMSPQDSTLEHRQPLASRQRPGRGTLYQCYHYDYYIITYFSVTSCHQSCQIHHVLFLITVSFRFILSHFIVESCLLSVSLKTVSTKIFHIRWLRTVVQ